VVTFLVDTSVWIGFFRDRGGPLGRQFRELLQQGSESISGCPPVRMELALDPNDLRRRRVLNVYDGFEALDISSHDFDAAAALQRSMRRAGHTIRSTVDSLVAATALRTGATLVHNDVDFDRIGAAVRELAVLRLAGP
jgi:predicted nucleic acid-binding protein